MFIFSTYHRICRICGKEFVSQSPVGCFCSEKCRRIGRYDYNKKYYAVHREIRLKQNARWRENNREHCREYNREHYRRKLDYYKKYHAEWRKKNIENEKSNNREYYLKNCELIKLNKRIRYYDKCAAKYYQNDANVEMQVI